MGKILPHCAVHMHVQATFVISCAQAEIFRPSGKIIGYPE